MNRPMMRINQQVLPYLTPQARANFEVLAARGFDADLALTMVEQSMDEADVFELPVDEPEEQEAV